MNASTRPEPENPEPKPARPGGHGEPFRLSQLKEVLTGRDKLGQAIRSFFSSRGFLEVDTPVWLAAPAPEEHIECPAVAGQGFLRASPELHMKRLLAALEMPIFQIGPCFRQAERGPVHLPEFTMLEWYNPKSDYNALLTETIELIRYCAKALNGREKCRFRQQNIDFAGAWRISTVDSAFSQFAGRSADQSLAEDCFELDLVEKVLPALCRNQPLVLKDFPLSLGSLARRHPTSGRAERWELFVAGLELANAYTELTDYHDQLKRFRAATAWRRRHNRSSYPIDRHYLELLWTGFPSCSGIALGFDRLLMVLMGLDRIDQVVPFTPEGESIDPGF